MKYPVVKIRDYISFLEEHNFKFRKYKKLEILKVNEIIVQGKNQHKFATAICTNQANDQVKLDATFLNIFYTKDDKDRYILNDKKSYRACSVKENLSFVGDEGVYYDLKKGDYILITEGNTPYKGRISGIDKETFKKNYVLAYKYSDVENEMLQM